MRSTFYPAIAFATDDGGYEFITPDVMGFTAYGEGDLFSAAVTASAALTDHLATLQDVGGKRPAARSPEAIRADDVHAPDFEEGGILVTLTAHNAIGRAKRVNISLDENDLAIIDRAAKERGLTRSAYLRAVALENAHAA